MRHEHLYYWEGEKPPPLTVRYEDEDGDLITTIAGATLTAKTSIDGAANNDVDMTNNNDGTMTIDWDNSTSDFVLAGDQDGTMVIDILVEDAPLSWYLPRFSIPVKKRT
jgi:hypothetical protein